MPVNRRRSHYVLGLSLLDVMACGLGAVLLVFLIIKHNTGTLAAEQAQINIDSQVATLENLKAQKEEFLSEIELETKLIELRNQAKSERDMERTANNQIIKQLNKEIDTETKRKASLEVQVAAQQPKQTVDVVEDVQRSEEDYLIGLKVEGRNIVLLIDSSASMTDDKLADIIPRKFRSDREKKNGPKWQRTVRTARWLLNRLPDNSEVAVVAFSESAKALNQGKWVKSRDAKGIQQLFNEIGDLIPTGATNLEAGLNAVTTHLSKSTHVYIITDGLPTKGERPYRVYSKCLRVRHTVSGECRLNIFETAIDSFVKRRKNVINVILLPLEGDPDAAHAYWRLAAVTGGLLLSPATGWP